MSKKKKKLTNPVTPGIQNQKGRQGWFLKERTESYEDWSWYRDGVCMETRRFYLK